MMIKEQKILLGDKKRFDGDRFIPSRVNFSLEFSHHLIKNNEPKKRVDIWNQDKNDWSIRNYEDSVGKIIGCDYKSHRVLPFVGPNKTKTNQEESQWPVKPRKKPTIGSPHSVLDLPNFVNLFQKNVLDWGRNNYIAAALVDSVYLWNASSSNTVPIPSQFSSAIKWHPYEEQLFIASDKSYSSSQIIKVWDIETFKVKYTIDRRHCFYLNCTISAVDWHPFVNVQATGCNRGSLILLFGERHKMVLQSMSSVPSPIITVSFSPNGRYLACSTISPFVNIWTFPDGVPYFRVRMNGSTRGMSWHPVKHSYLCLGDVSGFMSLWNVSKMCIIAHYYPPERDNTTYSLPLASIYCLTFSQITGELVTSHFMHGRNDSSSGVSQVNVLSSFDKLVDRFDLDPFDRVMYLKWNPDGTQIASAGTDETLQLWNFVPSNGKKGKKIKCTEKVLRPGQVQFTNDLRFSIR